MPLASNDSLSAMREAVRSSSFTNQRSAMLKSAQSALDLFRWTPALFFLIVLAQSYSQTTRVPLTVFSGILRRRQWRTRPEDWRPNPGLDTRHPYFAICLASAAITQRPGPGFFCGLALLLGWALWARRSKRYPAWVWGLMLAAAAGTGFAGQAGSTGCNEPSTTSTRSISSFGSRAQATIRAKSAPPWARSAGSNSPTESSCGSRPRKALPRPCCARPPTALTARRSGATPPPDAMSLASCRKNRGRLLDSPASQNHRGRRGRGLFPPRRPRSAACASGSRPPGQPPGLHP